MTTTLTVNSIKPSLNILGNTQQFIYDNTHTSSSFSLYNQFIPTVSSPTINSFEVKNGISSGSGYRWTHTTTSTDTIGSYSLQSFIGTTTTTDILAVDNAGIITFSTPVKVPTITTDSPANSAVTKSYVDAISSGIVTLQGAVTGGGAVGTIIDITLTPDKNVSFNNIHKITDLATPTTGTDAVNKTYVDQRTANWIAKATDYTVVATDYIVGVTDTTVARTITLPVILGNIGQVYIIKDETGGAATHNITVVPSSGLINGVASVLIAENYGVVRAYSDGTNWFTC